jgi:hypothetical protein
LTENAGQTFRTNPSDVPAWTAREGSFGLRERVEALDQSHEPDGRFLGKPAAVVSDPFHDGTIEFDSSDTDDDSGNVASFRETP